MTSNSRILEIRPGIAAVIYDRNGQLLFHRRQVGNGWAPVSGHIEIGESITGALHREILEETGLSVRIERLVSVNSDPAFQVVNFPNGRRIHFVTTLFTCRVASGTLRGSREGKEWRWFSPDNVPDDLLAYARVWIADSLANHPGPVVR